MPSFRADLKRTDRCSNIKKIDKCVEWLLFYSLYIKVKRHIANRRVFMSNCLICATSVIAPLRTDELNLYPLFVNIVCIYFGASHLGTLGITLVSRRPVFLNVLNPKLESRFQTRPNFYLLRVLLNSTRAGTSST